MSMYFCQGCQKYKDADRDGINDGEDGQYCDMCKSGETKMNDMEMMTKRIDANSIDIIELEKRVKDVEKKK